MKRAFFPALGVLALLAACSDDSSESSPADLQQDAGAEAQEDAAVQQEAAAEDAVLAAEAEAATPGDLAQVLGIWAKQATGDAMVVSNTCGNFYMIDFDFKYTRFSKAAATTLKVEYCKDETCATVEDGVDKTLEYAGGTATFSKTEPMTLSASCELTMKEDGKISFDTADHGAFWWKLGLTYKGTDCAQYKDSKMTGDTCEGIAQTEIDRVK